MNFHTIIYNPTVITSFYAVAAWFWTDGIVLGYCGDIFVWFRVVFGCCHIGFGCCHIDLDYFGVVFVCYGVVVSSFDIVSVQFKHRFCAV